MEIPTAYHNVQTMFLNYHAIQILMMEYVTMTGDPFLQDPEKFSHLRSRSKISNLMTTKLFYLRILNMNRGSLHTRSFRHIHLSVFKYRLTENGFTDPRSFPGFRETGPRALHHCTSQDASEANFKTNSKISS